MPSHSNVPFRDRVRERRKVDDAPEDAMSPEGPAGILQEGHLELICPLRH